MNKMTLKNVFLVDGIGALISALFLGVVLVQLQPHIGMPTEILYLLATLAICYAVYSFACHFFVKKNRPFFLKIIASANLLHCALTIGYLFQYQESITMLGCVYFIGEIFIVATIGWIEWMIALSGE